jgi:hypothetical protein
VSPTPQQSQGISIPELRSALDGEVIGPDDAAYDQARQVVFKGVDRRPAAVARVAGADDVARVVTLARESGLELAVRSGGHSRAGYGTSEGGIVIDLSGLRALDIDADAKTAWVETGMTAAEYTNAAGERRRATGLGDTGSVGIGGITLAGGIGFLVRKYGLTIDDLLAAEVVTADGEIVQASEESEPDLFWAIRGGEGNFGVATRLQLRLHEISEIVGGMLILPATPEVITGFIEAAEAAPEELSTIANVMLAPPMPFIPEEAHGQPVLLGMLADVGPVEQAEGVLAPFRALGKPYADMVRPIRYPEIYEGEGPPVRYTAGTNFFADALQPTDAATILEQLPQSTAMMKAVQLRVLGGALARVPNDATALRPPRPRVVREHRGDLYGFGREGHPRRMGRGPGRFTRQGRSGRLRRVPRRGGRGDGPRCLPGPDLGPAPQAEAPLRPGQPVPPQPQHPASGRLITRRGVRAR